MELGGDLGVRAAAGQQDQDLVLARGQVVQATGVGDCRGD
jgi:hypothetical protein